MSSAASFTTPAATRRVGGMMMPSWKMSVVSALMEPGRSPPTSAKCAHPMTKAMRAPPWNTGARNTWSFPCETAPCEP